MKKITVYTMEHCPFCEAAKRLFSSKGWAFEAIQLDMDDDKAWEDLERRTKFKTMPQIFVGDRFIGGYNDVKALDDKGELEKLVKG